MSTRKVKQPKFSLGEIVATAHAMATLVNTDMQPALQRHVTGDWGDLGDDDKRLNDQAVKDGERILSSYVVGADTKIWIITEADRSSTTFLLPEEY